MHGPRHLQPYIPLIFDRFTMFVPPFYHKIPRLVQVGISFSYITTTIFYIYSLICPTG